MTKTDLKLYDYVATYDELTIIDATIASIERGETATEAEVETAFAKFCTCPSHDWQNPIVSPRDDEVRR